MNTEQNVADEEQAAAKEVQSIFEREVGATGFDYRISLRRT